MSKKSTQKSTPKKKGEFPKTPQGQYKRWNAEFAAARPKVKKWHKEGDKTVREYLGKLATSPPDEGGIEDMNFKLNLFHSNVSTLMAMLYGNTPKVEVDRSFADAKDDVGRVASMMASRILNQDIQSPGATVINVLRQALEDRLLPGMGSARCKYDYTSKTKLTPAILDPETGEELAPEVEEEEITKEWVDIIYTHWKDILWSPCRTYDELRWKAYRSYMYFPELEKRFGEEMAKRIPLASKGPFNPSDTDSRDEDADPRQQAEVWEIWSKEDKKCYWYVEGFTEILDEQTDPMGLNQFWPDPPPMIANTTTSKWMPRSDYSIAQDLYIQINELETRLAILTRACKLVGVYDKSQEGIKRIFNEGLENDLIPVDAWAAFAEKGGLKGMIDWIPLESVITTIEQLQQRQSAKMQQLYEVTGMSDILRGVAQKYEAAATSETKAQFASIRVQALQDEFARFAGDLQSIKLEIMQRHFDPYCFIQQSNIENTADAEYAEQAIQLLQDPDAARWRVKVRPETLAQADYAQLKQTRGEFINGVSTFMQSAAPLAQLDKAIVPTLLELLQWGLAGFKGSNEIEGVMDKAIALFTQKANQPEQPKPDPAMEKIKAEMEMAKQEHTAKMQQEQQKFQLQMTEMQQEMQLKREEMQAELEQDRQKFALEMKQMLMEFQMKMQELSAELQFKKEEQAAQFKFNTAERAVDAEVSEHEAALQVESANAQARANKSNGGGE
jgi:hypothetical protein